MWGERENKKVQVLFFYAEKNKNGLFLFSPSATMFLPLLVFRRERGGYRMAVMVVLILGELRWLGKRKERSNARRRRGKEE